MRNSKEEMIRNFDGLLEKLQIEHKRFTHKEMKELSPQSVYYVCKKEDDEIFKEIYFTIRISPDNRTILFSCQRIYEVCDSDIKRIYEAINEVNQCALSGALYVVDGYVQYRSLLFYPPTATKLSSDIVDMYIEHIIDAIYLLNQELNEQKNE